MNIQVKKHAATIADERYTLLSDETEPIITQAVAQLNDVIGAISQQASFVDKKRIATLAALQLSVQIVQLKEQLAAVEQAQERLARMIDEIIT